MEVQGDRIKTDCFGYKMGGCTVLTEMVCENGKCTFYKTREQFIEDDARAKMIVERKKNNVK